MNQPSPVRLVVLISGFGSNLQALIDACSAGSLPAQVVAVFSNKSDAYGLVRARNCGIPAATVAKFKAESREEYDQRLADRVMAYAPDWVILAGWMRIFTSPFLRRFPSRIINLHPALPGMFPGMHAIEEAFQAYQDGKITTTGVMVHLVPDESVDEGPVLAQESVAISPDDTLETLAARVHQVEHRLLVDTIRTVIAKGLPEHARDR